MGGGGVRKTGESRRERARATVKRANNNNKKANAAIQRQGAYFVIFEILKNHMGFFVKTYVHNYKCLLVCVCHD